MGANPGINLKLVIMKTNEQLDHYFSPIDRTDCNRINGGVVGVILGAIASAVLYEVISDWDNFKAGLTGGPEIHYH
jgi:hypothetical protein